MSVQQLSLFLENKSGRLAAAAAVLKEKNINIRALTIAETRDYGIVRMIVNDPETAAAVLKDASFMVKQNPVIAVEVDDRVGVMFDIVSLCDKADLNIEYMYSFVEQTARKAILFLRFEDADAAEKLFAANGYKLLSADDAGKI